MGDQREIQCILASGSKVSKRGEFSGECNAVLVKLGINFCPFVAVREPCNSQLPLKGRQMLAPCWLLVSTSSPSGDHAMARTASFWTCCSVKMFQRFRPLPWKSRSWSSQTRTKPSLPPVKTRFPSGDHRAETTKWLVPSKVASKAHRFGIASLECQIAAECFKPRYVAPMRRSWPYSAHGTKPPSATEQAVNSLMPASTRPKALSLLLHSTANAVSGCCSMECTAQGSSNKP
mmetsp:Transcript_37938/g.81536  ORF Transcript_37938/g.81536 Transcript_37938/m.81536 type:complete len:233 (-) Transcript_37938:609-1307(-)